MHFPKWVLPEDPQERTTLKIGATNLLNWLQTTYIEPEELSIYMGKPFLCFAADRHDKHCYVAGLSVEQRDVLTDTLKSTMSNFGYFASLESAARQLGSDLIATDLREAAHLRIQWLNILLKELENAIPKMGLA